jgi:hypothetical protein
MGFYTGVYGCTIVIRAGRMILYGVRIGRIFQHGRDIFDLKYWKYYYSNTIGSTDSRGVK